MNVSQPNRQRGAALIIALVIVAMATILATTLMWETHLELRRTANQLYGAEALANALSVEDFVRDLLAQDDPESDHLLEPWARQGDVFPIVGGSLSGTVIDLQGKFNINNIYDTKNNQLNADQFEIFEQLLQNLGIDPAVATTVRDWVDPDIQPEGFSGAEDDVYLRNTPAYRTANGPIASTSELRLLANMTPEQYAVLEPYVTALPPGDQPTRVNINTAPPELLVALGLDPQDAARIIEIRSQDGFASIQDANGVLGEANLSDEIFSVKSDYFRLHVLAIIGSSRVTMYSILHRNPDNRVVRALSRSLGTP